MPLTKPFIKTRISIITFLVLYFRFWDSGTVGPGTDIPGKPTSQQKTYKNALDPYDTKTQKKKKRKWSCKHRVYVYYCHKFLMFLN